MPQLEQDQALIDDIDSSDADLNTTEADFVNSCVKRVERGQTLTEKQREWAQDILERIS